MTAIEQALGRRAGGLRETAPAVTRAGWRTVRDHLWFVLVLSAGLALRTLAELAYRPALLYIDSAKYLNGSGGTAPEGYQALLRLLAPFGGLAVVAAVQHAFGLAMAIAVYALLLRRGAPRWAATLAAAPVLLDAYQLQLEQTIMPDVLFETLITAGLVLLLWQARPGLWPAAAGGLVLGASHHRPGDRRGPHRACRGVRRADRARLAAQGGTGRAGRRLLRAAGPGLHDRGVLRHRALRAGQQRAGARVRARGGRRGLRHPRAPRRRAGAVPVTRGNARAGRHRRPAAQPAVARAYRAGAARRQPRAAARPLLPGRVRPAAAAGRGVGRQGFGQAVRADQGRRPAGHQHRALAVPDLLPDLPAPVHDGLLHPAGPPARQRRRPGGGRAGRPHPARLPAGRRLHARAAVRGLPGRRAARPALRRRAGAGPAPRRTGSRPRRACWSRWPPWCSLLSSDAFEFSWRYQLPAVVMLPLAGALGLTALVKSRPSRCAAPTG